MEMLEMLDNSTMEMLDTLDHDEFEQEIMEMLDISDEFDQEIIISIIDFTLISVPLIALDFSQADGEF